MKLFSHHSCFNASRFLKAEHTIVAGTSQWYRGFWAGEWLWLGWPCRFSWFASWVTAICIWTQPLYPVVVSHKREVVIRKAFFFDHSMWVQATVLGFEKLIIIARCEGIRLAQDMIPSRILSRIIRSICIFIVLSTSYVLSMRYPHERCLLFALNFVSFWNLNNFRLVNAGVWSVFNTAKLGLKVCDFVLETFEVVLHLVEWSSIHRL